MTDYHFRVHLIEARKLEGKDENGLSNPIAFVTVGNQTKHTRVHRHTNACVWDDLFLWDMKLSYEEMEDTRIKIEIRHEGKKEGDCLIGLHELEPLAIHRIKGHQYFRQWFGLLDNENPQVTGCTGYFKATIGVFTAEDDRPDQPDDREEDEEEDDKAQAIIPSEIGKSYWELHVKVYNCKDLAKVDSSVEIPVSGSDTFVSVHFGGNPPSSTPTIKSDLNPIFNTELVIPVTEPAMSDAIHVFVEDYNNRSANTLIGQVLFSFSKVKEHPVPVQYFHLYGEVVDESNVQALDLKAAAASLGGESSKGRKKKRIESSYRGTLLLAMHAKDVNSLVLMGTERIPQPKVFPPTEEWLLWFDLYEVSELAVSGQYLQEAQVEVCVGNEVRKSTRETIKNKSAVWYNSPQNEFKQFSLTLPCDPRQVPDVFINVYSITKIMDTRTRLGYSRISPLQEKVADFSCDAQWRLLNPDERLQGVSVPGFLLFGIGFAPKESLYITNAEGKQEVKANRQVVKTPTTRAYHLRVHLYQARNLNSADETSYADPYVIARVGGASARTGKALRDNISPTWYDTLVLDVDLPQPLTVAPDVHILVMDEDDPKDVLIGQCSIPIRTAPAKRPKHPTWREIFAHHSSAPQGEILVSIQLLPADDPSVSKLEDITPTIKECVFEINCVGVRDLLSFQSQPIVEPHLQFDMGDRSDGSKMKATNSSVRPNPANANMLQTLELPVRLPVDDLYAPSLYITVFDNRISGKVQVASAMIPLHWYMHEGRRNRGALEDEDQDKRNGLEQQDEEDDMMLHDDADIPPSLHDWNEELHQRLSYTKPPESDKQRKKTARAGMGSRTIIEVPDTPLDLEEDDEEPEVEEEVEDEGFPRELEYEIGDVPFETIPLYRGQGDRQTIAGYFKGSFRIVEMAKVRQYNEPINLHHIFAPRQLTLRVYVVKAVNLSPANREGSADPYLVFQVGEGGESKFDDNNKLQYKKDTLNPDFYHTAELQATVSVYSKDQYGMADPLIGRTRIDIEDRFMSESWEAMKPKPREMRVLTRPGSGTPKGKLQMALEIMTIQESSSAQTMKLEAPKPALWQLRLVVWDVSEVPMREGQPYMDMFVTGKPQAGKQQATDIHPKAFDGFGSFHWRMVWDLDLKQKDPPRLSLAVWDKNVLTANDAIGEVNLHLGLFYKRALATNAPQRYGPDTVVCTHPAHEGPRGKLRFELSLVPNQYARDAPVGLGRQKPNEDPELPEPIRHGLIDRMLSTLGVQKLPDPGKYRRHAYVCVGLAIIIALISWVSSL